MGWKTKHAEVELFSFPRSNGGQLKKRFVFIIKVKKQTVSDCVFN